MTAGLGWIVAVFAAAAWLAPPPVRAGPPYVTDDPEPTDTGHWEVYDFVSGAGIGPGVIGQTGFDINYGAARNLQLTTVIPLDYAVDPRGHLGAGDIEIAAKYRFLRQGDEPRDWDVSFFPRLFAPVARPPTGTGRLGAFLPLWAQKDWGPWSLFGGGGYTINPGPGQRDYWLGGVAVTRSLTKRLSVGVEAYQQTASEIGGRTYTAVNLGADYSLTRHWSLLLSGGPGVENPRQEGRYNFYLALKLDY